MDRQFLSRALKLGLREILLFAPESPVLCDDGARQYLWALLDKGCYIPASADAIRIDSASERITKQTDAKGSLKRSSPSIYTSDNDRGRKSSKRRKSAIKRPAVGDSPIEQAVLLRGLLRDTLVSTNQLIRSLKHAKRQNRLVASTLASLKQLQRVAG
jgi:hypothetical protein